MSFTRSLLPPFLVLLMILLLPACDDSAQEAVGQRGGLVGKSAPDFTLPNMQGEQISLSQFKGQVVVVNFWATWCPPCREEMPSMERLYQDYRNQGLVILAVNVEKNPEKVVSEFLQRTPYSFPILLDEDAEVQHRYGVFRYPESYIIDRNGVVVKNITGARDWLSGPTFELIDFLLNG